MTVGTSAANIHCACLVQPSSTMGKEAEIFTNVLFEQESWEIFILSISLKHSRKNMQPIHDNGLQT